MGNFLTGSPLAVALTMRAQGPLFPGPSWMARQLAPGPGDGAQRRRPVLHHGRRLHLRCGNTVRRAVPVDERAVREIEDVLRNAERSSDDLALTLAQDGAGPGTGAPPNRMRSVIADKRS